MIARTEPNLRFRPRLVLAYADSVHATHACRHFRRLGWEVHLANSGPAARELTTALAPQVVVLDVDLAEESGWLTCAKLALEQLTPQVVLVSQEPQARDYRFARLVGAAALVRREEYLDRLVAKVGQSMLAWVN